MRPRRGAGEFMRILTRYVLRAHVGPFLFAFGTITGLLFVNAIAQRLQDLTGKGLGWRTMVEFMVLSLPHTVALTLPMATLVAVLYAFSELTAHNEMTAMKAGGVRPQRLLIPLLGVGLILAEVMYVFNDQVLPEANHRLKELLVDVGRKTPTFQLREQVVNEIRAADGSNPVFLTASTINYATSELGDVTIYDADGGSHRTTYAASGTMAFNAERTDLFLTLHDGMVLETDPEQQGTFRQMYFTKQILPLRGVGNALDRRSTEGDRGDREMTIAMLRNRVNESKEEAEDARRTAARQAREVTQMALGRRATPDAIPVPTVDPITGAVTGQHLIVPGSAPGVATRDMVADQALTDARTSAAHVEAALRTASRYEVEIQKKYALSFACAVFVLIGAPLALRFPRGGTGLVIAASSAIFAISWSGLIGGESLADRGIAPPAVGMWAPNAIFLVIGTWMAMRMGRERGNVRGGGWDELLDGLRDRWARLRGRADGAP